MGRQKRTEGRVTIQAVAARAGVSAMTVSNVCNGTGKVGDAARARVLAAIDALGYVPNQAARALGGSHLSRLGLLYADVESLFLQSVLSAVANAAAARGIQLITRVSADASPAGAIAAATDLVRSGGEALLLVPPFAEALDLTDGAPQLAVPMAAIATAEPTQHMHSVRIDNRAAAAGVTRRLLAAGRRRIAVISGPRSNSDSVARLLGHHDALNESNLSPDADLEVIGAFTFASGLEAADRLLDLQPIPDAIVCANDDMAAGALWAAHRRGITVPAALAVTGFDDTLLATRVWPALTTVRQPIDDMVRHAIEMLSDAVRSGVPAAAGDVVLPSDLVERGSA